LILRKISKVDAVRCQILTLKCTKFYFRWGSAPDRAGGAYSAPPDPLAVYKGPTSRGREERDKRGEEEGEGKGREEEGRGKGEGGDGKGGEGPGPQIFWLKTAPVSDFFKEIFISNRRTFVA